MAVFDVNPTELILKTAEKLKDFKEIQPPDWARFVKTGHGRDRPPVQDDWWYIRSAAVLRKLMIKGPIGVNKLRVLYGNRKNYGMAPEHFVKASGNILRKILQQLEKANLVKKAEKEVHKGRVASSEGIALIDKSASELLKERPLKKIEAPKSQEKTKVKKKEVKEKPKLKAEKKEEKTEEKPNEEKKKEIKAEEKAKVEVKKEEKQELKEEKPKEEKKEQKAEQKLEEK